MNIHVDMLHIFVICMYYMSLIVYKYLDTNVIISEYECTMFCHGKRSNGSAIETIYRHGVHVAVAHTPGEIGNFGGRLERVLMIVHGVIGNKMDNNIL